MKLNYTFEFMEIDDEVVAIPVGENAGKLHGIIKMNATGAEILKMIQAGKTEVEIVPILSEKYNLPYDDMRTHVIHFLHQLVSAELMVCDHEDN